jgi:hypothetical protein
MTSVPIGVIRAGRCPSHREGKVAPGNGLAGIAFTIPKSVGPCSERRTLILMLIIMTI